MKTVTVTGSPRPASRIALGTMIVRRAERARSFALLDAALDHGITTLDLAHCYSGGDSERCVGEWLRARGHRHQVTLLTKGCHPKGKHQRVTPRDLNADLTESLTRLGVEQVDVYMLHRDDPEQPVGPLVECLNEHRAAGRIGAFGGSNWSHQRIAEANRYAAARGLQPFTASSPHFSLAEQVDDPWGPGCVSIAGPSQRASRSWYAEADVRLFAYSSLARGLFSGRIARDDLSAADHACRKAYCHDVNFRRLERAHDLAADRGLSVAQIAMAWVLGHPLDVVACCGAASAAEIAEAVTASEVRLSADEREWLDLRS